MAVVENARYSSKIIKAGALLPDTKMMLTNWDESADVRANLKEMQHSNLFGKTSRSRIEDILAIFRQRYLSEPGLLRALVILAKGNVAAESLDRILYFLALRADPLLHDAVTELLAVQLNRGRHDVDVKDVEIWLRDQIRAGKTPRPWNEETTTRVARGILATLRDFGVLQGVVTKRIAPMYLPVIAFSFIAFVLSRREPSGDRLLYHPEWQIFFLHDKAVERLFLEAHAERTLAYYAAGRVIRVEFPAATIEEYAHALAQRTY